MRVVSRSLVSNPEIVVDQGPRRRPFRPQRKPGQQPNRPRPQGVRPPGNPHRAAANARSNYERYTALAKDAARLARQSKRRTASSMPSTIFV